MLRDKLFAKMFTDSQTAKQFLGHTRAADLLQKFSEALGKLNLANLFQVSMDGPNMNLKFFNSFCSDRARTNPDLPHLMNVGSCGLHVVYGAFKYGVTATDWKLDSGLRKCLLIPKYFCAVYDYAGKTDLSKGYWNPKRKLGVTMHFSEITKA